MKSLTNQKKLFISLLLNIAVLIMEIIGLVQSATSHGLGLFQFYTEDSNLFALVTSFLLVIFIIRKYQGKEIPSWMALLKYMTTCCLCVTFLVVITVLAPIMGTLEGFYYMLFKGSMLYHHFLCPIIVTISFLLFDPIPTITKKDTYYSLIPTLCYAIIFVILNIAKVVEGPYPFLLVYQQPIYMSCIWFVIIIGLAYLISWGLRVIFQKIHK